MKMQADRLKTWGFLNLWDILPLSPSLSSMEWTTELLPSGINYYRLLIGKQEVDAGQILINK